MSWGSEQNYEVTQIKTLLNPPNECKEVLFVLYGWVLADLSLVASHGLFPVTSILFLLLASNS